MDHEARILASEFAWFREANDRGLEAWTTSAPGCCLGNK